MSGAAERTRLDVELHRRGLAPTREKARALIMAGRVQVDERQVDKPGAAVKPGATITVIAPERTYVSRGGDKLAGALDGFGLEVDGRRALDVGSSTGGFTHCLLERGVTLVHAIDVGKGLLDWTLRQDPRVHVHEGVNARYLDDLELDLGAPFGVITADLAFISLTRVLPVVWSRLADAGDGLLLVKPQFELGRSEVGKGVVRDPDKHARAVLQVAEAASDTGFTVRGALPSPLKGAKGNREFFLWLAKRGQAVADLAAMAAEASRPA